MHSDRLFFSIFAVHSGLPLGTCMQQLSVCVCVACFLYAAEFSFCRRWSNAYIAHWDEYDLITWWWASKRPIDWFLTCDFVTMSLTNTQTHTRTHIYAVIWWWLFWWNAFAYINSTCFCFLLQNADVHFVRVYMVCIGSGYSKCM